MKKFLLLIEFIFTATSHAEIVKNLNVIGNERINIETIKVYGNISINKNYDPVAYVLITTLNNMCITAHNGVNVYEKNIYFFYLFILHFLVNYIIIAT